MVYFGPNWNRSPTMNRAKSGTAVRLIQSSAMYVNITNQSARNPRSLPPTALPNVYTPPESGALPMRYCRFSVITRMTIRPRSRPKAVPRTPDFCRYALQVTTKEAQPTLVPMEKAQMVSGEKVGRSLSALFALLFVSCAARKPEVSAAK